MSLSRWLILPLLISSCAAPVALRPVSQNTNGVQQMGLINTQGVVRSTYRYSTDKTSLTVRIEREGGVIHELSLQRTPISGSQVEVETIIFVNGSTMNRHRTTVDEAELAVKVAANNGWQDVYHDLKERYQLAGLFE